MKSEPTWRRYLRFWGGDPAGDVEDEFQFHLQTKIEELIASGLTAEEARREALRQFGPVQSYRNECRSIGKRRLVAVARGEYLLGWLGDLRYTLRVLSRAKASTLAAVAILAAGIGAGTAVFTFFDRLLYQPLPVREPSRLIAIATSPFLQSGKPEASRYLPYEAYLNLRDANNTLAGIAAEANFGLRESHGRAKIEKPAWARAVSGNYFEVLSVRPLLGRALAPADEAASADPHVAVAGYRFWSRRFGRSPNAIGSAIYLNDEAFTIVGVLPEGFYGTRKGSDEDLYVPIAGNRPSYFRQLLEAQLIGRLRPGVAMRTAQANLQALWTPLAGEAKDRWKPQTHGAAVVCADASAGYSGAEGETQGSLRLLAVIVGLLLLMACVNVACLLAARGAARRHEMAIRLSLGAGKARILRQSLLESLLVALAGGTAGVLLSLWASRLLLIAFQWRDKPIDLAPDVRVLAFGLGLSLVTGLLFGLAPALQSLRGARVALLPERTVAPRFASGKALIVFEVALSLVMVAGAAVFIRSFRNLRTEPTGFSAERVSVISLAATDSEDFAPPTSAALQLADSLRATPRIEAAGVSDLLTFDDTRFGYTVAPAESPQDKRPTNTLRVDGAYFSALRVPLIAGRTFTDNDDAHSPMVVILCESAARRVFGQQNPIGRSVAVGKTQAQVVGIVNDIKFTKVTEPAPNVVFQPVTQDWFGGARSPGIKLQVRSRMAPDDIAALVRARIRERRLAAAVDGARSLEDAIGKSMLSDRVRMQASSLFGALALALIAAGIYGLMAYSVARRTREIGVRMAVGSKPAEIMRLILHDSLRLALIGIAIGLPGALVLMRAVSGMLFGLAPFDPASLVAAAAFLLATAVAASAAPAWRAAHLDPVQALRVE